MQLIFGINIAKRNKIEAVIYEIWENKTVAHFIYMIECCKRISVFPETQVDSLWDAGR